MIANLSVNLRTLSLIITYLERVEEVFFMFSVIMKRKLTQFYCSVYMVICDRPCFSN